jgi:membrane protease YdiL (CAAX protease family)
MQPSNRNSARRPATPLYRVGLAAAGTSWGLLIWMFWQILLELGLAVDPRVALAWTLAVTLAFLQVYVWGARRQRARARIRVRSPGRAWPWLLAMIPAFAVLPQAMYVALLSLGLAHDEPLPKELTDFMARPLGTAAFWLLALAAAPLVEEFAFRGWIQRPLERAVGAQRAIAVSALLFALAHGQPEAIPVRLAAGLVLGQAVYATRSIWTGVALHVSWNAASFVLDWAGPDVDPTGKGWGWGGPAAALSVVCLLWCAWIVGRMQDAAGRSDGTANRPAAGRPVASS